MPGVLSFLIYGRRPRDGDRAQRHPAADQPPVEIVYYAYHIMVGLGTIFIALLALSALALWRGRLFTTRGAAVGADARDAVPVHRERGRLGRSAEVGRQPWIVYGLVRTADATSTNVSGGMTMLHAVGLHGAVPARRRCSTF